MDWFSACRDFKSWILSVVVPETSTENYLYVLSDALNIYLYIPFPFAVLSLSSFRPGAAGSVTRTFGLFYTIFLFVVAYFDVLSVSLGSLL